jgi:hypothetical protein
MPDKPSKNEDEYFARRDAELLSQTKEHERMTREDIERKTHYMKCPKTGHDLVTILIRGVQVDTCPTCGGLWLDAGELGTLLKHEEPGLIRKVLGELMHSMGRGKKEE